MSSAEDGGGALPEHDPVSRDRARRAGWTGPLRGPLHPGGQPIPADPCEALGVLVPAIRLTRGDRRPGLAALARRAVAGMRDAVAVQVDDGTGLPPYRLVYPDRPGLMAEEVARVLDTARALRLRFGRHLAHLRTISIDRSDAGFRSGHVAGLAEGNLGQVKLNASLFLPDLGRERQPRRSPTGGAGVPSPADLVAAHELWHQVELIFTTRDYSSSVEFRRRVGTYFGVATIEHVMASPGPARDQLVREVSAYAATNALEATAEMAMLWWFSRHRPSPVAAHFDAVVAEFFPPPPPPA